METVAPLVRAVIRAFYADEASIVIEQLLREPFYLEDDERPKGKLSQKFGGISSTKIRQILTVLEKHSLIHMKPIFVQALPGEEDGADAEETVVDESTQQRIVRVKRFFYYIDFVHFVKLMTLRLSQCAELITTTIASQAEDSSQNMMYFCPECERKFDVYEAMPEFMCLDDKVPLIQEGASAANASGVATTAPTASALTPQRVQELKEKFQQQMRGELDQRDDIGDLLKRAQNAGPNLPENDPAKRIAQQENEKRRLEALALRNQDALPDVQEGATIVLSTEQRQPAELASWLQISSITGQMTEDAFRDREERQAKQARVEQAEAIEKEAAAQDEDMQRYIREAEEIQRRANEVKSANSSVVEQVPIAATATLGNPEAVFTFMNGKQVRAVDINEDNLEELREQCTDEEDGAFFQFVSDNVAL